LRPSLRDHLARTHDPPDTHARNAVRLGEAAGDDHAIAHFPEARRALAIDLRTLIDFVREQIGAHLFAARDNPAHGFTAQNGATRIVGIRQVYQARPLDR